MLLPAALPAQQTIIGQAAFADWNQQQPGVRRKIILADLPQPNPEEAVNNTPHVVSRPPDAWPLAPAGFKVTLCAGGDSAPMQRADNKKVMVLSGGTFTMPRLIRTPPNGDGLDHPFGIAFYPAGNPKYVYVGNATAIQRFPYHTGDLHASGPAETIVPDIPGYAQVTAGGGPAMLSSPKTVSTCWFQ
jgi:glucose/arabinose dehydrogenase